MQINNFPRRQPCLLKLLAWSSGNLYARFDYFSTIFMPFYFYKKSEPIAHLSY